MSSFTIVEGRFEGDLQLIELSDSSLVLNDELSSLLEQILSSLGVLAASGQIIVPTSNDAQALDELDVILDEMFDP